MACPDPARAKKTRQQMKNCMATNPPAADETMLGTIYTSGHWRADWRGLGQRGAVQCDAWSATSQSIMH